MPDIVVRRITSTDIPEELARAVQPILLKWEAAAVRVARASDDRARTWPQGSPENLLQERFRSLQPDLQERSRKRAAEAINRQRFARRASRALGVDATDLGVDFSQLRTTGIPRDVDQQAMATQTLAFLRLVGLDQSVQQIPPGQAVAPPSAIVLRMRRMVCVDETNAIWPIGERGQDEISIGGATLDTDQATGEIKVFECGNYDDGTRRDFPPQDLVSVSLQGATFPRAIFATLVLAEVDGGGIEGLVKQIVDKLAEEAKDHLAGWLAGLAAGAAFGGLPGAIIGLVVGYLIDKLVDAISSWWDDDPFTPATIMASLPSTDANFNGSRTMPSTVVRFRGPGEYAMRYDWQLR